MDLADDLGGRVNAIRKNWPEWRVTTAHSELQLNQWTCFLPKNSPSLSKVTIIFFSIWPDTPPTHLMFGISVLPPPWLDVLKPELMQMTPPECSLLATNVMSSPGLLDFQLSFKIQRIYTFFLSKCQINYCTISINLARPCPRPKSDTCPPVPS